MPWGSMDDYVGKRVGSRQGAMGPVGSLLPEEEKEGLTSSAHGKSTRGRQLQVLSSEWSWGPGVNGP